MFFFGFGLSLRIRITNPEWEYDWGLGGYCKKIRRGGGVGEGMEKGRCLELFIMVYIERRESFETK